MRLSLRGLVILKPILGSAGKVAPCTMNSLGPFKRSLSVTCPVGGWSDVTNLWPTMGPTHQCLRRANYCLNRSQKHPPHTNYKHVLLHLPLSVRAGPSGTQDPYRRALPHIVEETYKGAGETPKRVCCFHEGPKFSFPHLCGGSQLSVSLVPRDGMPLLASSGTAHMQCTHIRAAKYSYTQK